MLRSVKDRIAQKFNVAVSETGHQDKWQRCELSVAAVAASAVRSSGRSKACARCWTASPSCESSPTRATSSEHMKCLTAPAAPNASTSC